MLQLALVVQAAATYEPTLHTAAQSERIPALFHPPLTTESPTTHYCPLFHPRRASGWRYGSMAPTSRRTPTWALRSRARPGTSRPPPRTGRLSRSSQATPPLGSVLGLGLG